jgi:hypothetical protein
MAIKGELNLLVPTDGKESKQTHFKDLTKQSEVTGIWISR